MLLQGCKLKVLLALALLTVLTKADSQRATYNGYKVVRTEISTAAEHAWLKEKVLLVNGDIWAEGKGFMDVMLPTRYANMLAERANKEGLRASITVEDVQSLIDAQMNSIARHQSTKVKGAIDHTTYRTFDQLQAEIDELEASFPDLVSTKIVSETYEGRPLRVVTVSSDGTNTRPTVWVDCGIHAREWVSQATCLYILDQLTSQYGVDSAVTSILDTYDIQMLPVTNPDGYAYSWEHDRIWRKNRVPYGLCHGTDPNRNFDSHFGGEGTSDSPCSDIYHGPSAFSEAESSAIRDCVLALGTRAKGFYTLHSYSQFWMTPYGYAHNLPADYDEQYRVSEIGVTALTAVHGTHFTYGNIADVIYVASGGSTDWAYDSAGVLYPFALELRDTGRYGFLLPEDQIVPTGEETFAGLIASIAAFK